MILDIDFTRPEQQEADVVVIGGGIAGLILADRIAKAGQRVIVLESGGHRQEVETHPLNETEQIGQYYKGAEFGRFRCLGGTSTRWGGALIPFVEHDCCLHPDKWDADWLGLHADLMPYLSEAEKLFALPGSGYEAEDVPDLPIEGEQGFTPRLAKWPPFSKRNVAQLLGGTINSSSGPAVWLNATAAGFSYHPDGRLASVQVRSPGRQNCSPSASMRQI